MELDHFRLTVADLSPQDNWTKRALTSDIAKMFDVLGWFAPIIVKEKILLQRLWEEGLGWDGSVPPTLEQTWLEWRQELGLLVDKHIPRCYTPKTVKIAYRQLHGFSDASEVAYAGVVYLRLVDTTGCVHVSLVIAKTKVAPIKRLSIPRLELCGALLLAQLLHLCLISPQKTSSLGRIALSSSTGWLEIHVVLRCSSATGSRSSLI